MGGKRQVLSLLETVFLVMVVVNAVLPHGHPVDAAHARAAAVFRLTVIGIGAVGWIVVAVLKRRLPPDPPFVSPPVGTAFPGAGVVSHDGLLPVTYNSSRAGQWRCHGYILTRRWQGTALMYLFPISFCLFHAQPWLQAGVPFLLIYTALTFAGWTALLGLILWLQIVQRLPNRDSLRLCTTTLTPGELRDAVPEKTATFPWAAIKSIRENGGDLYFWVGATSGQFIPRSAFRDQAEAQEFHRAALAYWKGGDVVWTHTPVQDRTTWPPPPQAR